MAGCFDDVATPPGTIVNFGGGPYTLGSDFTYAAVGAQITGIQFWKWTSDTGTHVGTVYRKSDQANLGSVTFAGETASGWQSQLLGTPIPITQNVTYRICVSHPVGYAYQQPGAAVTTGFLSMAATSFWIGGAGFPNTADSGGANYLIDIVPQLPSTLLDFPNPPLTGNQTYAAPNGVTYTWDGAAWVNTR